MGSSGIHPCMRVRMRWGRNMKPCGAAVIAALLFAYTGHPAEAKKQVWQKCVVTIEHDSGHFAPLTKDGAAYLCKQVIRPVPKWRADPLSDGSEGIAFEEESDMVVDIDKD